MINQKLITRFLNISRGLIKVGTMGLYGGGFNNTPGFGELKGCQGILTLGSLII